MAASNATSVPWTLQPDRPGRPGPFRAALGRLARNKLALIGSLVALIFAILGLVGPALAPYDYAKQSLLDANLPPLSPGHLLGTDQLGRDMLSRLLVGIRISLAVGLGVTVISMVVGTAAGAIAGYMRGPVDTVISSLAEIAWGFPLILIAVILAGSMGPGLMAAVLAIGLVNWAGFARVVRGDVLALRSAEYVEAARAGGASDARVLLRHILPNIVGPALVMASYYVALAIVVEAGLSFIGMGAQPPLPSLGAMTAEGRNYMLQNPWVTTLPGVTVLLIVLG
ncbi:MAG: ABC transporter permease, partial [Thermomicrobiales bacterium]|nr:ABC transporter permease [Thermomicrobiales bacterium]